MFTFEYSEMWSLTSVSLMSTRTRTGMNLLNSSQMMFWLNWCDDSVCEICWRGTERPTLNTSSQAAKGNTMTPGKAKSTADNSFIYIKSLSATYTFDPLRAIDVLDCQFKSTSREKPKSRLLSWAMDALISCDNTVRVPQCCPYVKDCFFLEHSESVHNYFKRKRAGQSTADLHKHIPQRWN